MRQVQDNLLFRWFVSLGIDDPVWVLTVFTMNQDRLLTTDMSRKFLAAIMAHQEVEPLPSDEFLSVDGTLVKAWASTKNFQPKDHGTPPDDGGGGPDNPPAFFPHEASDQPKQETTKMPCPAQRNRIAEVDFWAEMSLKATQASTTDPRFAADQEVARHGCDAVPRGEHGDGKPERTNRAGRFDHSRRPCRTACRDKYYPPSLTPIDPTAHARRRQGLRQRRFCR